MQPVTRCAGWVGMRIARLAVLLLLVPVPVAGQSFDDTRAINAARDSARAQERQARALERLQVQLRDQAIQNDRAQRNAERDSRSSRRFDRP